MKRKAYVPGWHQGSLPCIQTVDTLGEMPPVSIRSPGARDGEPAWVGETEPGGLSPARCCGHCSLQVDTERRFLRPAGSEPLGPTWVFAGAAARPGADLV